MLLIFGKTKALKRYVCYDLPKINTNNFQILKIMPTFEKYYNCSKKI